MSKIYMLKWTYGLFDHNLKLIGQMPELSKRANCLVRKDVRRTDPIIIEKLRV